jgi:phosphoglucomutase
MAIDNGSGSTTQHTDTLRRVEYGFRTLTASPDSQAAAVTNLERWMETPEHGEYLPQLQWLVDTAMWSVLLDSFHRVLPFGTGGRRGPVGIGTNRFNPVTLSSTVQGHVEYLRDRYPNQQLAVVIAYDVRRYADLRRVYNPDLPNPLIGITSRQFAQIAASVYAANGVHVHMLPEDSSSYVSTPELSFSIRRLGAQGGLNISASHNHPDDNGGKFYGAHGGQEVPPDDDAMSQHVERVTRIRSVSLREAKASGLIHVLPAEVHAEYIRINLDQSLHPDARAARVVFTPLHGTSDTTVGEVLRGAGFEVHPVPEQSTVDGMFPSVPFRAPNPEVPESMHLATELARELEADIVFACDPDADRIGVTVRDGDGNYRFLTGNEIAVVVTSYKLAALRELGRLPQHPLVLKTEVTTDLLEPITRNFGGQLIGDLLVGFKYHGNVLGQLESAGRFGDVRATIDDFIIATEESHGILVTPTMRDKDAAGAAILMAELAAIQRAANRTVSDYLDDIYLQFGYYANLLVSTVMTGAEGLVAIQTIQSGLRTTPPEAIGGLRVVGTVDHRDPNGPHGPILSESDRVSRDVLLFQLEGGARVIVRPSGTEPKNKIYIEVPSAPLGAAAAKAALREAMAKAMALARRIGDDLTNQMLGILGIQIPSYALRVSGLVSLDRRVSFAREFIPALEAKVIAIDEGHATSEDVGTWIDESLRGYGEDARGLVAEAIRAYLDEERERMAGLPANEHGRRGRALDTISGFFLTTIE